MKLEISVQIFENNTQISYFKEILQWVPNWSMLTDRQTVRPEEANSRLPSFANKPKNLNLFNYSKTEPEDNAYSSQSKYKRLVSYKIRCRLFWT
jgi:hypothetical protein